MQQVMVNKTVPCEKGNHSYIQSLKLWARLKFLYLKEKVKRSCGQCLGLFTIIQSCIPKEAGGSTASEIRSG